jgi:hypothetical protein
VTQPHRLVGVQPDGGGHSGVFRRERPGT